MKNLKQIYKNKIKNLRENYTTTSIIIYHILIIASLLPIPTIENILKNINPKLTENNGIIVITAIFFFIASAIALDFFGEYFYEFGKSFEKYPKFNKASIASLFLKKSNNHAEINIATIEIIALSLLGIITFKVIAVPIIITFLILSTIKTLIK